MENPLDLLDAEEEEQDMDATASSDVLFSHTDHENPLVHVRSSSRSSSSSPRTPTLQNVGIRVEGS